MVKISVGSQRFHLDPEMAKNGLSIAQKDLKRASHYGKKESIILKTLLFLNLAIVQKADKLITAKIFICAYSYIISIIHLPLS